MADNMHTLKEEDEKRPTRKLKDEYDYEDEDEDEDASVHAPVDVEDVKPRPLSTGFWARCWIITVIFAAVLVAVIFLIILFPKIAQSSINGSTLTFQTINITNPKNTTFAMHIVGRISNAGSIGATIHFPDDISVYWNSTTLLGNITLADLNIHGGWGVIDSDVSFTVLNTTAFTEFSGLLLSTKNFTWRLLGSATVYALGRTASKLTIDKTITINGMNGFPNPKILDLVLPVTNSSNDGAELEFIVQVTNPSPIGLQLGALNLDLTYQGIDIGPASTSNLFLGSGVNNVALKTTLVAQPTSNGTALMNELLSNFVQGIPSITLAHGVSAFPNGKDSVSWLSPAIKDIVLNITMTVPDPNSLNETARSFAQSSIYGSSLVLNTINITNETSNSFTSSLDFLLNNTGPLPATVQFPDPVKIYYNGSILGTVGMPSVNVSAGQGHLLASASPFQIMDLTQFGQFTKTLLQTKTFEWTVVGNVTVLALNRTLTGLSLNKTVTLNGMNGFYNVQIQAFSLSGDLTAPAEGGTTIQITALMQNPSPLGVQLGTVNFQIAYQNVVLGPISTTDFFLVPGNNLVQMSGKMSPQSDQNAINVISQLFTQYSSGQTINATITGVSAAPDGNDQISWLQPGIQSLVLTGSFGSTASTT
jgi:hypothetical protein